MGRQRWPGADILDEARGRLAVYAADWRDGINAGTRIIAPSTYIFLASLLPALAFGLQLDHDTYGLLGVVQVLAATALGGVAQAVCGGQPLLIVGVAEPVVIIYAFLYRFAEGQEGLGRERFLPWAAWVCVWTAIMVVVVAAAGACRAVDALTRFSGELFGALIGILFLQQAVKGLIAQFRLDPNGLYGGDTSAGGGAGAGGAAPYSSSPSSAAAAAAVSDLFVWRLVNGLWSLLLAAALLLSCLVVVRARSWRFLRKWLRGLLADFGPPAMVLLWTGISFAISPATSTQVPPGVPRRVASGDVWRGANPAGAGDDGGGGWRVASRMAEVPGGYVAAAALPAFVIAVLFYFDHSVSSQMAQQPEYNLVRPASYAYDLALLGGMTLACGLLGLPPVNGVLPQAPMHTRSLATLGRPRAAKKQQHHHGQQQQKQQKQQLEDEQQQQQQTDEQRQQQQPQQQQEEEAQQQGHDHRRQSAQEGLAPPSGPSGPGLGEGWETARAARGPPTAAAAAATPANSTPAATMSRAVAAAAAAAAVDLHPPASAPPPRYWPGGLGVPAAAAAAAAVNGGANQPTAAAAAAAAAAGCNGAGVDGGSDGGAGRQRPQGQVVVVVGSARELRDGGEAGDEGDGGGGGGDWDGAARNPSHLHRRSRNRSVRVFGVGDGGADGGVHSCGLPDGAAEAPEAAEAQEAEAVSRARLLSPCQLPSGPTSCPHEQARSGGSRAAGCGGAGGGGGGVAQQHQHQQHQQQQRQRSGCCGRPAAEVAEATLPAAVAAAAVAAAVPHGAALPLRVLEQRLSNLLQSLGVAACLFGTPAIRQIPQAAVWGYFAVMAIESFQGSQLVDRVLLLLTDPARRPTLLRGPHAPYLETVPFPTIAAFTGLQVALLAGIWALVTWAGVGGIAFPLPIMALVPLRRYLLPRFFRPEHLRELDCAEYEQVPPASAPVPPPPPPPPSHTPPLAAGALTPAVAPPPSPPLVVVGEGGGEGGGGGGEEEQTWPGPARFPAAAAAGDLLQAPAQLLIREAAQAQAGEAAAPEPVGGFGGLEAAPPAAVEAQRRRAEVEQEEEDEAAAAAAAAAAEVAAVAVAVDREAEREIIEAEHVGVQPVHHLTRGQLRQRVGAAAAGQVVAAGRGERRVSE